MRTVPLIALVVALVGCHNGLRPGSAPSRKVGSFAFRISLSGREPVDGSFSITKDTVTLQADGQDCRREFGRASPRHLHHFSCFPPAGLDKFGVTIDSDQPYSSDWTIVQSVMKTRQVCARYTLTERGQRVCAQMNNENYFEDARVGGRLLITSADTSGTG